MERQIKYIVQVHCEPLPIGLEGTIVNFLSDYFNVTGCSVDNQGMILELRSSHAIAYGAIKDLADLIVEVLNMNGIEFRQGVINRVEQGYAQFVYKVVNSEVIANHILGLCRSWSYIVGNAVKELIAKMFGGTRLVPEMYFHGNVLLDVMLSTRVKQLSTDGVIDRS
ncbi:MAG: hypothetical protein CL886_03970 [Dehalococcoidia bacterium]|nr:hypothetical protein [Dehalococcoidia bacterium]